MSRLPVGTLVEKRGKPTTIRRFTAVNPAGNYLRRVEIYGGDRAIIVDNSPSWHCTVYVFRLRENIRACLADGWRSVKET